MAGHCNVAPNVLRKHARHYARSASGAAPQGQAPVVLALTAGCPAALDARTLKGDLEAISHDLMVEIVLGERM